MVADVIGKIVHKFQVLYPYDPNKESKTRE